jgi:hypothetical protein
MKALVFFLLLAFSVPTHAQSATDAATRANLFRYNSEALRDNVQKFVVAYFGDLLCVSLRPSAARR